MVPFPAPASADTRATNCGLNSACWEESSKRSQIFLIAPGAPPDHGIGPLAISERRYEAKSPSTIKSSPSSDRPDLVTL
jgi:hypothetical protein